MVRPPELVLSRTSVQTLQQISVGGAMDPLILKHSLTESFFNKTTVYTELFGIDQTEQLQVPHLLIPISMIF